MAPSASTSAAKTQILQHAGTGPTARTPTKITDPATHSSQQFRPRAAKSRRTSPEIPIDRHCRWRILPRGFLLRGFSDACLRAAPRAVTGRHPKTLNDSGPSSLRHTPRGLARGASNFDLPAQLHDPVRGNAEELGCIQGEVAQEDEQPIPPCQKSE